MPTKGIDRRNERLDEPYHLNQKEVSRAIEQFMYNDFKMFQSVWTFRNVPAQGMRFADNRTKAAYVQKLAYQCMRHYIEQQGLQSQVWQEKEKPSDNPMVQPPIFSVSDMRRIHDSNVQWVHNIPKGKTHTVESDGYKWWYKRDADDQIWLLKAEKTEKELETSLVKL